MEFVPSDWSVVLMRLMLRRSIGDLGGMDLIFIILVAEAAAHSMGDYKSIGDGIIVIVVLMGCNYLVNFLSYHVPFIERIVSAPPIQVIKDGRLLRRNMRREFLTEKELMENLRQQGVEELKDVKEAHVESEGKITVISKKEGKS